MVKIVSYLHVSLGCNGVNDGWFVPDGVLSTRTHNPRLSLRWMDAKECVHTHIHTYGYMEGWGGARGVQPQRKQVDRHLFQHDMNTPTISCQGISFSLISLKHHLHAANTWTSSDQVNTPFVFVCTLFSCSSGQYPSMRKSLWLMFIHLHHETWLTGLFVLFYLRRTRWRPTDIFKR